MALRSEQVQFLRDVVSLLQFAWTKGFEVTGGELLRTPEQQEIYVQQGRSQTKNSMHLKKCAIDLFVFLHGAWVQDKSRLQVLGDYWESLSPQNRWGGNWKFQDSVHFERKV